MKFIIIIAGFIGAGFLSEIKGQKGQAVISMMSGVGNSRKDTVLSVKIGAIQTRLPITVINGRDKGPVFSIVAGVHGYEYPPVIAVQELLKEIKPEHIRGTLIIVPVANMESFQKRTPFVNPLDQKNLNKFFQLHFFQIHLLNPLHQNVKNINYLIQLVPFFQLL